MGYRAKLRVWRGDDGAGELRDYTVEANEGEVVLNLIHRLQATQAPDLAVRWNCKAGKCGSCSAEVDGCARACLCMTRLFGLRRRTEVITVTPMLHVPGESASDLVTDVSLQLRQGAGDPGRSPHHPELGLGEGPHAAGRVAAVTGIPQMHRMFPVPERLPRDPGPRGEQTRLRRAAVSHAGSRSWRCTHSTRPDRVNEGADRARTRLLQHHQVLH